MESKKILSTILVVMLVLLTAGMATYVEYTYKDYVIELAKMLWI